MNTTGITLDMEIASEDEDVPKPGLLQQWLTAYSHWLRENLAVNDNTLRLIDDAQQTRFTKSLSLLADRSAPIAPFLLTEKSAPAKTSLPTIIALRVVSPLESQTLNAQYRQKDRPTNVLSFPGLYQPTHQMTQLGDLAICASVVAHEASAQAKSLDAHWAHLLLHGTLHLLGFDHETDADAELMESLEIQILASLGFNDPYAIIDDTPATLTKTILDHEESPLAHSSSSTASTHKSITEA